MGLFDGMGHGAIVSAGDKSGVKLYLAVSDSVPVAKREALVREALEEAMENWRFIEAKKAEAA